MIKYIIIALLAVYCIFVLRKIIKSLKAGRCVGCSGGDNCCCNEKKPGKK